MDAVLGMDWMVANGVLVDAPERSIIIRGSDRSLNVVARASGKKPATPTLEGAHVDVVSTNQFIRALRVRDAEQPFIAYIKELLLEEEEATPEPATPRDPAVQ